MTKEKHDDASLNQAFHRKVEAVRRLLARADLDETRTRHKVGVIVARLRDAKGTYGDRAVERVATELKLDASTLYRYATVASLWSERELSRARNCSGEPLSWSHWVELARVPSGWSTWLERVVAEAWSARNLARQIDAASEDASLPDLPAMADTTRTALLQTVKHLRRFGLEVTSSFEAVLDRMARASANEQTPELAELLAMALDLCEDAHKKTGVLVHRIRILRPVEVTQTKLRTMPRGEFRELGRGRSHAFSTSGGSVIS
jgi:hypothetical protein